MTIRDLYLQAIKGRHKSLMLMIQYLVNEKKVLNMEDSQDKLKHYLKPEFQSYMNKYLSEYEDKVNGQKREAAN